MVIPSSVVAGTFVDEFGVPVSGITVLFTLETFAQRSQQGPFYIQGVGILGNYQAEATTDANGQFTVTIFGNDIIQVGSGSYFQVTATKGGQTHFRGRFQFLQGGNYDLLTATPLIPFPGQSPITVPPGSTAANLVLAGPTSGVSQPGVFRSLVNADLPNDVALLGQNQTLTGNNTFSGIVTVKDLNKVLFADQFPGATADIQINNAVAALPLGGTIDCRGYGATVQTIAATVTVGSVAGPVVLIFDRATTFNVTITNGSMAFSLQPGSCMIALGEVNSANANGGNIILANGAIVSNVIKFVGVGGGGNFSIENISIASNTSATVTDAVISVENGLQISTIKAVGIGGFTNCAGLRISTGVGASTGPINIYNMYIEGLGVAGFTNVVIQDTSGGGTAGGVNFFGGTFTHPGNASPRAIFNLAGVNGGVNGVNFYGCFLESISTSDVGIYIDDCTGISINDVFFSANGSAGADCVFITGSNTDTIVVKNLNNFNAWTNSINNVINGHTITASRFPWYSYQTETRNHAYYDNLAGNTLTITGTGLSAGGSAGVSEGPFTSISSITTVGGVVTGLSGSSDERLKNSLPYADGLDVISKINPVKYTLNKLGQKQTGLKADLVQVGFLAQDIQRVIPEAITGAEVCKTDRTTKYLCLDTKGILAAAVNAIRELNTKIETLEAKLRAI